MYWDSGWKSRPIGKCQKKLCQQNLFLLIFTGTTLLQALNSTTFGNICLKLDQNNNWKDLGRKINIPDETLQKIATSTSPCTAAPSAQKIKLEAVLEIIGNKNPGLTVKEMKLVLKEMRRTDVCDVLEDLLQGIIFYCMFPNAHWKKAGEKDISYES